MNILKRLIQSVKSKSITETIEQIHHEFNIEGELLLQEAKKILSKQIDTNKGDRLNKLGFYKAKEAIESKTQKDKLAMSERLAKTIEYFQLHYPNKFIDDAGVERICKKYGLIVGNVSQYLGSVPDKNLLEIERFKLREEDIFYERITSYSSFMLEPSILDKQIITKKEYESIDRGDLLRSSMFQSIRVVKNTDSLIICAPMKDFELTEKQKIFGYKILDIPDPVVLQRVLGGYLIVSAWGIEALDNEILNPKNN